MNNLDKIYNSILEKVIMPIGDWLNGSCVMEELQRWRTYSTLNTEEIDNIAQMNLENLLDYAVLNVPYYHKYAQTRTGDSPYDWIKQFPIIKKMDIHNHIDDMIAVGYDKKKLIECKSSGSSGIQGVTYENKKEQSIHRALQILFWEWSGYYLGKRIVQTGMTSRTTLKQIKDILLRTYYIFAFNHDEKQFLDLLHKIQNKHNMHLAGYASSLNVFAEIAQKNNINIHFDAAISWGDKLFEHYARNILNTFKCKCYDTYGCSEGVLIGAKKDLDYFYIMSPHVYVEIVEKDGNDVADGELGYVLITRLDAYSMPLIRYYIGDLAVKLPKSKYPIKRELPYPLLERVIGRDTDIVRTRKGAYLVVHAFTGIFEHYPEIRQFKVVQYNLDGIEIDYIKGEGFSINILDEIRNIILAKLHDDFTIIFKEVEVIEATKSGKPQIVQSFI